MLWLDRPQTIIKDDAVPELLRQQHHPTFVTTNERDFWQKVAIDHRYCVVCFVLPDSPAQPIGARGGRIGSPRHRGET